MSKFTLMARLTGTAIAVIVLALSTYSLYGTQSTSLPFPSTLPILNLIIALTNLLLLWFIPNKFLHQQPSSRLIKLLTVLGYIFQFIPIVLATFAWSQVFPKRFRTCIAETQWSLWFRAKDEAKIRSIQSTLRCCGLNSVRDRAWPFPSHNVDAHACERIAGPASVPCGPLWERGLLAAANTSAAGSVFTEILVLFVIYQIGIFWNSSTYSYFQVGSQEEEDTPPRGRLTYLENDTANLVTETYEEDRQRQRERERALTQPEDRI